MDAHFARARCGAFAEPLIEIGDDGRVLDANAAFAALARRCGVAPRPEELFGPAFAQLVSAARRDDRARLQLPVIAGPEPRPIYRVAIYRDGAGTGLVALLIDVSEEAAVRRQLVERAHVLTVLNDMGAALAATLDVDALAERLYEQTTRLVRASTFYLALHDPGTQRLSFPLYVEERTKRDATSRPLTNGLTEYVLRTGHPLLLNDEVGTRARELGIAPRGRMPRSWLGVPVPGDPEPCGVIALQDFERASCFTLHDLEVLTIVAAQAGAGLRNARLFASARDAYRGLSEAQARLLESERLRGVTETVGALNHEINNPLAAIAGNAQLLLRHGGALAAAERARVESILEAARRIQRVTAKMSSLIQASAVPYPGAHDILDVTRSVARDEPGTPEKEDPPAEGEAPAA